jgi:serine/threonine protein kinase
MSPEQIFRPKEVDLRSDLWSAAVVAYRCLTGVLPFQGDTFGTMCLSVHDGQFAPPNSVDSTIPQELDAWFTKALSLDPGARFQSASEMANAYLTELSKAGLLPRWAALRDPSSDQRSYTSDPGGISGGPIVLRREGWPLWRTVVLAVLALVATAVALTPREAFLGLASKWFDLPAIPHLNPTIDEPPLRFDEPAPVLRRPAGPAARAPRNVDRVPVGKRPIRDDFGLMAPVPRDRPSDQSDDVTPSTFEPGI